MTIQLQAITETDPAAFPEQPQALAEVLVATRDLYRRRGFAPPWICYLALENDVCVGTCGFTAAPQDEEVELAYFTFPAHEGRGIATRMARALLDIAGQASWSGLKVIAHTMPAEGASTRILRRCGFACLGTVMHPEDGAVWKWQYAH